MNTGLDNHIAEELLEKYALRNLVDPDCALLEEHLLTCLHCQTSLEIIDDYIRIFKAAASALLAPHKLLPRRRLRPSSVARAGTIRNMAPQCAGLRAKIPPSRRAVSGIRGNTDKSNIRMV